MQNKTKILMNGVRDPGRTRMVGYAFTKLAALEQQLRLSEDGGRETAHVITMISSIVVGRGPHTEYSA